MTYWIGSQAAIEAANAIVTAIVTAEPAYRDGAQVPNPTTTWADPSQTADGQWAIPAYPGMAVPAGCAEAEAVDWADDTA